MTFKTQLSKIQLCNWGMFVFPHIFLVVLRVRMRLFFSSTNSATKLSSSLPLFLFFSCHFRVLGIVHLITCYANCCHYAFLSFIYSWPLFIWRSWWWWKYYHSIRVTFNKCVQIWFVRCKLWEGAEVFQSDDQFWKARIQKPLFQLIIVLLPPYPSCHTSKLNCVYSLYIYIYLIPTKVPFFC